VRRNGIGASIWRVEGCADERRPESGRGGAAVSGRNERERESRSWVGLLAAREGIEETAGLVPYFGVSVCCFIGRLGEFKCQKKKV
jgi:hypothetical protein